jgi:hypothetical protein
MDPDEFMARMMAAGVPDMQLVPSQDGATSTAPPPKKPPPFATAQPATEPTASTQAPPDNAGGLPADQLLMGAAPLTPTVPLPSVTAAATLLPTHSAPIGGGQAVVPDVGTLLPNAAPAQYIAPAVPSSGATALTDQGNAALQGSQAGGAAGIWGRPPTVEELERAGVSLVLEAEAAGRLKRDHRFLYAVAEDLLITDVAELLSFYKVPLFLSIYLTSWCVASCLLLLQQGDINERNKVSGAVFCRSWSCDTNRYHWQSLPLPASRPRCPSR